MSKYILYTDGAYSSSRDQGGIGLIFLKENNKILVINLPKINYGALKENQGIAKAKIRYVIHIRKVKRLGVKDKYYKLGKKILTYKRKNKYNIKQMDMGIYSVRYQVVIIGKNQTKYTKWSKKKLIEI